jgi:hypothetical protein
MSALTNTPAPWAQPHQLFARTVNTALTKTPVPLRSLTTVQLRMRVRRLMVVLTAPLALTVRVDLKQTAGVDIYAQPDLTLPPLLQDPSENSVQKEPGVPPELQQKLFA